MKKGNKKIFICITLIIIIVSILLLSCLKKDKQDNSNKTSNNSNELVKVELEEEYTLELGTTPSIDMFTNIEGASIKIYYNDEEVNGPLNNGGEYLVVIKYNNKEYKTKILVEENVPVLVLKELTIKEGESYNLNNFVVSISGTNEYKLEFTNNDMEKYNTPGIYDISIKLIYNNEKIIVEHTKLIIKDNTKSNSNKVSNSTSNKVSNSTSNKVSNSTSNKVSNKTSNKPISNSNSNNNSNKPVSNSNSNSNDIPVTVVKEEKKTDTTTTTKYGAKIITTTTYTLTTYSNGTTKKSNSNSATTLDSSGFITSTSSMKSEATNIYNSTTSDLNEMLTYVNKYRKEKDSSMDNLVLDKELSIAATIRAMELAYTDYKYKHQRPDGTPFYTVLTDLEIEYNKYGENIAYGHGGKLKTAKEAAEQWKSSEAHYGAMTDPKFTKIGIGHVTLLGKEYWVQIFIG